MSDYPAWYKVGRAGALYKLDSPYWEVTSGRVLKLVEHSACACLGVSFYRKISALFIRAKLATEPQTGLPLAAGFVDLRK